MDFDINIHSPSDIVFEKDKEYHIYNELFDNIDKMSDKKMFIGSVYFYLFDGFLHPMIGSSPVIRDNFLFPNKLYDLLNINIENKKDISYGMHATIFYKIAQDDRYYIYYSNSGKGIENQTTIGNITHSKIYYINTKSEYFWDQFPNFDLFFDFLTSYINSILTSFNDTNIYSHYYDLNKEIEKIIDKNIRTMRETYKTLLKLNFIDYFILNKNINNLDRQMVCYYILNFIAYKLSIIQECSFNHIISGKDDTEYIRKINLYKTKRDYMGEIPIDDINSAIVHFAKYHYKYSDFPNRTIFENKKLELKQELTSKEFEDGYKDTKTELISFCYNQPYINISEIDDNRPSTQNEITYFHDFIEEFNRQLDQYITDNPDRTTLSFIRKRFKLVHKYKSGLYNNQQTSGSCTFYSLYNLGINLSSLAIFNDQSLDTFQKKANVLLKKFLKFHYAMLITFCKLNDIKKINGLNNNFFDIYIYDIIKKYNLLIEMNQFYKEETFILNQNKLFIDKLLDYNYIYIPIQNDKPSLIKIEKIDCFSVLFKLLDDTIYQIRNKIKINWKNLLEEFNKIFNDIDTSIKLCGFHHNDLYHKVLPEIYIANLITLEKSYNTTMDLSHNIVRIFIYYEPIMDTSIEPNICDERWIEKKDSQDKQNRETPIQIYDNVSSIDCYHKYYDDYLISRLKVNELNNIGNILEQNGEELQEIRREKNIEFIYCKYIKSLKITTNYNNRCSEYNTNKEIIYRSYNLYFENDKYLFFENLIEFIKNRFISYYRINQLINNSHTHENVKTELKKNIEKIKNNIKEVFNNDLNISKEVTHIALSFLPFLTLIFTNNEHLIFLRDNYLKDIVLFSTQIYNNTHIYKTERYSIKMDEIKNLIMPLINDGNINPLLINLGIFKIPSFIKDFGFTITDTNKITKDKIEYKMTNIDDSEHLSYIIIDILKRFGISCNDKHKYLLLFQKTKFDDTSRKPILYYTTKYIFYVLIEKFKKCIKISIDTNEGTSHIIKDECFISDSSNPTKEYQLLFDLTPNDFPFIKLIPEMAPYLCYKKNNEYNIDIILSCAWIKDKENEINYKMFDENFKARVEDYLKENPDFFNLFTMIISPSLMFPKLKPFNTKDYIFLCKYYYHDIIDLSDNPFINKKFEPKFLQTHIPEINRILLLINQRDKYFSNISITPDDELFKQVFDSRSEKDEIKSQTFKNFRDDNRLCNDTKCDSNCKSGLPIKDLNDILNKVKSSIENRIYKEEKLINDFVLNNFDKFLLIMELNILIKSLEDIKNPDINCWDIQEILIKFKTIEYFNKQILTNFYYGFELLFLLQNEYFFKETQMQKYEEIRNDYSGDQPNSNLKVHQFMMGKGKTSVFTPLLAFGIKILKDKQPTIITLNHLKEQTQENLNFIQLITKIKINIFSDFEAKKRWIENTDQYNNLKKEENINLKDEWNIIDEFDSHHNYLQSMFNYVKDLKIIDRELFDYVYEFTNTKLDPTNSLYTGDPTKKIKDINIEFLNINLNNTFNESNNIVYNENYGFAFLKLNDKDINKNIRICTPFVRKDTPIKNSDFSSILLRLILTFKIYIQKYDRKLNDELFDIENLFTNKSLINDFTSVLPDKIQLELINEIQSEESKIENIKNIINRFYSDQTTSNKLKDDFLKEYLWNINIDKLKETQTQVNLSFQDIIYNNYEQWQVGYTGTISMDLNHYVDSEKFVFKEKIEDFDEIIEVKLALKGYGSPNSYDESKPPKLIQIYDYKVKILNNNIEVIDKITEIINLTFKYKSYNVEGRGFIDLAGIFLDYDNKTIAEKLFDNLPLKKIIYFGKNDKGFEYNRNINEIEHTPKHNDNFYYYDQCHTVGSDLKQPNIGHIVIIINKYTKYTDFAQAIFRFRKLNRGTFMSIIFMKNITDSSPNPITNDDVLNILNTNEKLFNDNQLDGIKYQLMKAMIRKDSKNYLETELFPEYKNKTKFTHEDIISRMHTNIKNLTNEDLNPLKNIKPENKDKIKSIYDYLTSKDKKEKLKELIIGSGNEKVSEQSQEQEQEQEQESENEAEQQIKKDISSLYDDNMIYTIPVKKKIISHLNCEACKLDNCIKLFNTYNVQINKKQIYISINLLSLELDDRVPFTKENDHDKTRHCFIEFNDYILIELESIGYEYYIDRLPVYDYLGKLMNSYFFKNKNKLDIDQIFTNIFKFDYYFKKLKKIKDTEIKENINNMSFDSIALLYFYNFRNIYHRSYNRYKISEHLYDYWLNNKDKFRKMIYLNRYYKFKRSYFELNHNEVEKDNIFNKNLSIYEDRIIFNENGYSREVISNKVYFFHFIKSFNYTSDYRINDHSSKTEYINYKIIDLSYCSNYINENKLSIENKDHSKLKDEIKKLLT
jgi:hypothetical protein